MLTKREKITVIPKIVKTICPKCNNGYLELENSTPLTMYMGFVYTCTKCKTQYKTSKSLSNIIYEEETDKKEVFEEDIDLIEIENK